MSFEAASEGLRAPQERRRGPRLAKGVLRRPAGVVAIAYLVALLGVAIVAPIVMPQVNHQFVGNLSDALQGPSWAHPLGTDPLGRDVLDRLLVGARVSLIGVGEACSVAVILGVVLGVAAGYLGGWVDRVVGPLTDLALSVPGIAVVLVVVSVFPQSMLATMGTLGMTAAPYLARVIRSRTLMVREELYLAAARVSGLGRAYIMARHVFPRILATIIVIGSLFAAGALLAEGGFAYLGLLGAVPAPSWGGMIGDGITSLQRQPWLIWPPGIAMGITTIAFVVVADVVGEVRTETWAANARQQSRRMATRTKAARADAGDALLAVRDLTVSFPQGQDYVTVIEDITFDVNPGEAVGLVGESGSGKSVTGASILGLLPGAGFIRAGQIFFDGRDLASSGEKELRQIRGRDVALISQEPSATLNPAFRIETQLGMLIRAHHRISRRAAHARVIELLSQVRLSDPEGVARRYPHELSGGMAQRVAIARAIAGEPRLLIADEPTTALDVTVQAEVLDLLRDLRAEHEMAVLLITHDWGVIADSCERAIVMYAGQIVEQASVDAIFRSPLHPYTAALQASNPHFAVDEGELPMIAGAVAKPGEWPTGCHFHPRCGLATSECARSEIRIARPMPSRETRCIHFEQLLGQPRTGSQAATVDRAR